MKKAFVFVSLLGGIICCAASAFAQAGAPTQRVHIPGIPDGTSIYPKGTDTKASTVSIGCVAKSANGEFTITDWRGGERPSVAGSPPMAPRPPLVLRLRGDKDMLGFQVGHEVQITGAVMDASDPSKPAELKVESLLYLSRNCWERGTMTPAAAKPKP